MAGPSAIDDTAKATGAQESSALAKTITTTLNSQKKASGEGSPTVPIAWQRYELHQEIGAGGMGRVVAATDKQFGREIAVKQLLRPSNVDARERFELESFVTGNLEHPGIPAVYERGQDEDSRPYYSMRRVQGRTLTEAISACNSLAERLRLVPVVIRVAQTLAYAHGQGVVHRDIKPDNIIVGLHGETFVLDWGIAKIRGIAQKSIRNEQGESASAVDAASTLAGQVIGTPAYMAPEQAAGKSDRIDERTDVFALGGILYHLLTGHPPYHSGTLADVLRRAKACELPDINSEASDAPSGLREICAKALAKDPDDRFAGAEEVAIALESFTATAISREASGPVGTLVKVASVVSLMIGLLALVLVLSTISGVRGQGPAAMVSFLFAGFGLGFSIIEFKTRGKYKLSTLALGLALATLFNGLTAASGGFVEVLAFVMQPEILASSVDSQGAMLVGSHEAVSCLASGASLATLQVLAWAIARRQTLLG